MTTHAILSGAAVVLFPVVSPFASAAVVFTETMGSVASTTILDHESADRFDNDTYTFSGSAAEIRTTSASAGYAGAGGGANAYLPANASSTFQISGISTSGFTVGSVGISFGAYKSSTGSNMTTLVFEHSSDGTHWTAIGIPAQTTGSGTANWRLLSFSNTGIPITPTLHLRWTNTDTGTAFRIDDVVLTAIPETPSAALGALGVFALLRRRRHF